MGQKLFHREHLVSYSIVMVENPVVGTKFRPSSMHSFMYPLQYFNILTYIDCLVLWYELK